MKLNKSICVIHLFIISLTFLLMIMSRPVHSANFTEIVNINVTVACDEEWRKIYGDHWKQAALNAIEEADKELILQFGINLRVYEESYVEWNSNDWELNLADLLEEVYKEVGVLKGDDILLAFTGQKTDYVGMAYVNGKAGLIMHQNPLYDGIVTRHEVSHILGCLDEDPPAKSIMSEWWDYPATWGTDCESKILKSRERFTR